MTSLEILQKETENAIEEKHQAQVKLFKIEQSNHQNIQNYNDSIAFIKKIRSDLSSKSIEEITNSIDLFLDNEKILD